MMRAFAVTIGLAALVGLTACSDDRGLMNLRSTSAGPDEFAILPTRPLAMPPDLAVLPAPTPGDGNITDPTPVADAVGALGGNPAGLNDRGIGAADQPLVAHAGRRGTDPAIRTELAQADADRRSRSGRRLFERLFGTNVYMRTYQPMRMDAQTEQDRWQRAGAQTPSAPPRPGN